MQLPTIPIITPETFQAMADMTYFTHALLFDDLLIVAQRETSCFVLKTAAGLMVIDAIWPSVEAFRAILAAIRAVGWEPRDLKKLLLTHGHADHTGCGRWLVEQYQVETLLSREDDLYWQAHPIDPSRPETRKDFPIHRYLKDGDRLSFGEKTIHVYGTPGHTPGCLSYLFPVTEGGRVHIAALFGGATPPRDPDGAAQYLRSLAYFRQEARDMGADVALSNHTALDQGLDRIAYSRRRMAHMPNCYVLGQRGLETYWQVYEALGRKVLRRLSEKTEV